MSLPKPKIELPGWWWKKHFEKYRILRSVMQDLSDYCWSTGMKERNEKLIDELYKMMIDKEFHA